MDNALNLRIYMVAWIGLENHGFTRTTFLFVNFRFVVKFLLRGLASRAHNT